MKLVGLLGSTLAISLPQEAAEYAADYGFNFVDCPEYFTEGGEWPLSEGNQALAGRVVKLCQNVYGKPHYYATLFSVDDRIPVYSAVKKHRDPNAKTYPRPESTWTHFAMGLCLPENTELPDQSFYSNIASVSSDDFKYCSKYQADDYDYWGNTGDLKIDRGHLVPNGVMNQIEDASKATFTLTNVSPQHSQFNQLGWNQLECMVRRFLSDEIPNKEAYLMTGTYDTKMWMNENNDKKNNIRLPKYYWKAFCYTDERTTYSWAYIQLNDQGETWSKGELFISVAEFSETYYNGAPIFNEACQNAGFGPWNVIINGWSTYLNRWRCDYT